MHITCTIGLFELASKCPNEPRFKLSFVADLRGELLGDLWQIVAASLGLLQ